MTKHKTRIGALTIALLAVLAVAVAGMATGGASPAQATDPVILTVTGADGTTVKTFTMTELQALPAYTGYSGIINSAGTITEPKAIKGVLLTDLFALVGGMTAENSADVQAIDDYGMTYTYDEVVNGAFQMYDDVTGEPEATASPVSLALIYEYDGAPLASAPGGDGPLRLAVSQAADVSQVADGHLNVKWVDRLTLRGAVKDWTVKMVGLKRKNGTRQRYTLDRKTYDSCATPGCHGASWVEPATTKTWSGVPLFLCIGKIDGGKGHGGYGAYNERLALKGYRIKLISTDGKYRIIGSRIIMNRDKIILANKLMGSELTESYYPLRLMGPKIGSRKFIGKIAKIQLLPK